MQPAMYRDGRGQQIVRIDVVLDLLRIDIAQP
jgi:hypothetical protein